jgi:hypothetical protein
MHVPKQTHRLLPKADIKAATGYPASDKMAMRGTLMANLVRALLRVDAHLYGLHHGTVYCQS